MQLQKFSARKLRLKSFVVMFVLLLIAFVSATFITKADVEKCVQTSEDIDCSERLIVGVTVSFGLGATLDAVSVTTIEKDGEPQALEETVSIDITKTAPYLNYPLIYWHTVAYYPHEEVIKVKNAAAGFQKCVDSKYSDYPTCGWTMSGSSKIEDSQGFCCNKGIELLNDGGGVFRGEVFLEETSTLFNSFSTGHCLRMGELMFHGYEIEESARHFLIQITLTRGDDVQSFSISPTDPIHLDVDSGIKATLEGEFADYLGAPELDNYILYVPGSPLDHTMVINKLQNMLLVPREMQSKDGSECDKVGVSFDQFRKEGSKCDSTEVGDCLGNQLYHLHNQDLDALQVDPNTDATYLVSGKKKFKNSMSFERGSGLLLKYKVNTIQNSLVSLEMDLASLKVISTESVGIIVEAYVKSFSSHSRDGTMVVKIQNVGDLKTSYVVTVTNCNMGIVASYTPAQARELLPAQDEPEVLEFHIRTDADMEQSNQCLVSLLSRDDKLYDSVIVKFDTTKFVSEYSWEIQEKNEGTTLKEDTLTGLGGCECAFLDIACKFVKMCWIDILIMVLIVVGVILLVIGVIIFFCCGGAQLLPTICCCCCKACRCCVGCVTCFTKFFAARVKDIASIEVPVAAKGTTPRRVQKRRPRQKRHDYSSSDSSEEVVRPKKNSRRKGLREKDIQDYCDENRVCYLNVSSHSDLGREMLHVMRRAMPLAIDDEFSLVGTIRFKHGTYQFIVHEDLLDQTWFWEDDDWVQCMDSSETRRIQDKYRGYSLQLEHVLTSVSEKPWIDHCVLNQPLEL